MQYYHDCDNRTLESLTHSLTHTTSSWTSWRTCWRLIVWCRKEKINLFTSVFAVVKAWPDYRRPIVVTQCHTNGQSKQLWISVLACKEGRFIIFVSFRCQMLFLDLTKDKLRSSILTCLDLQRKIASLTHRVSSSSARKIQLSKSYIRRVQSFTFRVDLSSLLESYKHGLCVMSRKNSSCERLECCISVLHVTDFSGQRKEKNRKRQS